MIRASVPWVAALLLVGAIAAPLPAQWTPPPPGGAPAANIGEQINRMKQAAEAIQRGVPPLVEGVKKIVAIEQSYPQAVKDFKAQHGLPQNPTPAQEAQVLTEVGLQKAGVGPQEARGISRAMAGLGERARGFKVLDPTSIMLSVGIAAGANVVGQLAVGEGVDIKRAMGFVTQPSFWGGIIGSSVGWSLAGYAVRAFLPAGFGGVLAPFLPTFASMTASIVGWHLGSGGMGKGLKETFRGISVPEVLAQAAGSTMGLFVGAQVASGLGAAMGSFAGPVGSILGAVLFGHIAVSIVRSFKGLFSQAGGGPGPSIDPSLPTPSATLPAAPLVTVASISKVKEEYAAAYGQYVAAEQIGDRTRARALLGRLRMLRRQYDLMVRAMVTGVKPGHQRSAAAASDR